MPMINPFAQDAFNLVSLTNSINILPNNYGRIRELNLFPEKGVMTRTIILEELHGVLTLLPTMPVGSPGTQATRGKRKIRSLVIPHIPHDDSILPDEYAGIRDFGSENAMQSLVTTMNNHLQTMRNKHAITLEWLRVGALKGVILDADGSVLYNLFNEFGIEEFSVDFELGTDATDVRGKCMLVLRHIEFYLMGEVMTGVRALVSPEFFDNLTNHPTVKAAYANWTAAQNALGGDLRKGFTFGGITWEECIGQASDANGKVRRFIDAGEAQAFPEGTMQTFQTVFAPGDFLDTVNTIGLPLYARQEPRDYNRGVDIHTQSNPLPLCCRPSLLVKCFSSN